MTIRAARSCVLSAVAAATVGCESAIISDPEVVAKAGDHEVRVDEVARWLSEGQSLPLRRDVIERFMQRWVEYSLYAQRVAAGDSLTDSLSVLRAMWPDIEQAKLDVLHDRLVEERVALDSAVVDSAYHAGERRVIFHILIRTQTSMSPSQKERARQRAEQVRAQAVAGAPWADLNDRYSEDPGAKLAGGNLGVVRQEDLVPPFAEVAFALEPGGISDVTETSFGYHVIWRPRLEEVRDRFEGAIRTQLVERLDSLYYAELDEERRISVREEATALAREAVEAPLTAMNRDDVLGSYRGGRFTIADLMRWLQVLSPRVHRQIVTAGDEQLTELLRTLIRNEVLILEARQAGIAVPGEAYESARLSYVNDLRRLRGTLGLDSVFASAASTQERHERAREAVNRYLARMMRTLRDVVIVPPFLASELRQAARWEISDIALDRVVSRATELRRHPADAPSSAEDAATSTPESNDADGH
jgi:hypothetical protein